MKRLNLDVVWWLVSPQNPLKPKSSPFTKRIASARSVARGPKMVVTDFEKRFSCAYTYQTLRLLRRLYPGVSFFLLMGADNLANFHRWKNWREVARSVPVVVVARPGAGARDRLGAPKDWVFLNARYHKQSSTALRTRKRRAVAKAQQKC
jgi:nicotinate-nucleotide adenylyltransferase